MQDKDYIIKKYSDVIEEAIANADFPLAIECINHMADFYLSCTCPCEEKDDLHY